MCVCVSVFVGGGGNNKNLNISEGRNFFLVANLFKFLSSGNNFFQS